MLTGFGKLYLSADINIFQENICCKSYICFSFRNINVFGWNVYVSHHQMWLFPITDSFHAPFQNHFKNISSDAVFSHDISIIIIVNIINKKTHENNCTFYLLIWRKKQTSLMYVEIFYDCIYFCVCCIAIVSTKLNHWLKKQICWSLLIIVSIASIE